jgi:valyl-tRNA synthetase
LNTAKREAKRLEKEVKMAAKAAKTISVPVGEKKVKGEKEKEANAPFINNTPKGEKKGKFAFTLYGNGIFMT